MICPAGLAEAPLLQELDERIFGNSAWSEQQWRSEMQAGETLVRLAMLVGEACGFVTAGVSANEVEIRKIGILPRYRRRGIAQELLAAAIKDAPLSPRRCLIDVSDGNAEGIAFYQAMGFAEIGRRRSYYSDGSSAIVMEKILSAPQANPYIT